MFYFILIIFIVLIFIWICIDSNYNNKIQEISWYGYHYLIQTYLVKSFQKVTFLLKDIDEKSMNQFQQNQIDFVHKYTTIFCNKLLSFVRGSEICKQLHDHLYLTSFEKIDIFLIPDSLVNSNEYYKNLLYYASSKKIEKTNDEAKIYLASIKNS